MQAIEFFFFAILIGAVTLVFSIMTLFYKYVDSNTSSGGGSGRDERASLISNEAKSQHSKSRIEEKETDNISSLHGFDSESEF